MGTTVEKATKAIQSIAEIQQGINNLGGSLTDQTPLDEFRAELDDIYAKFPKTDYSEGSNITLENCLKGKLDYEDDKVGYGDTYQYSTKGINFLPSITTQTLNGITLTNNGDGTYYVEGTASALTYFDFFAGTFDSTTYENYYLKEYNYSNISSLWGTSSSAPLSYRISASNRTAIQQIGSNTTTGYIQIENNGTDLYLSLRIHNGAVLSKTLLKPMLLANSSQLSEEVEAFTGGLPSPNPSYPQNIQVVTGEQEVVIRGKNLVEGLEYGDINAQTGAESAATGTVRTTNYMPYSRLKSYRQSINGENLPNGTNLRFYNKDKVYIGYATFGFSTSITDIAITKGSSVTTTDLEPKFFRVRANATTLPVDSKYMIATSDDLIYEPYITPITKQLSLGDIELAKIGTYRDYPWKNLTNGKWYKHSEVGKETFTGGDSENWVVSQSGTANWFYSLQKAIGGDTAKTNQLKSNYYPYSSITSTTTGEGIWYSASYIRVRYGTEDTPSNYKTWLSTHNVLLYYILATPTDTEITDTNLINQLEDIYNMQSVNGTTILEINGNLPMIMKVRALSK